MNFFHFFCGYYYLYILYLDLSSFFKINREVHVPQNSGNGVDGFEGEEGGCDMNLLIKSKMYWISFATIFYLNRIAVPLKVLKEWKVNANFYRLPYGIYFNFLCGNIFIGTNWRNFLESRLVGLHFLGLNQLHNITSTIFYFSLSVQNIFMMSIAIKVYEIF